MKLFLTFILFFTLNSAQAQDSLSIHALTSSFYAGVPFQQIGNSGEWYNSDFEIGFTQTFSIRLKNRFFLSFGAGINYREYRTAPVIRSWTTYSYSPSLGNYIVQYHEDDYERQSYGRFTRVKVPLQLEYMPLGKWTPYARAGVVFDAQIRERFDEVYANTSAQVPVNDRVYPSMYGEEFSLSATASGGIKYGYNNVELLFGLSTQVGLTNFKKNYRSSQASIVGEISIRKTIRYDKFPHQRAINVYASRKVKKNYLYAEGMGSVLWASLNYERSIFQFGKNRIHARVGFSAEKSGGAINTIVPIGLTYIYGRKHGVEAGSEYVQVFGHNHAYLASHLGYRIETNKNLLMRFNVVGAWYPTSSQFFVVPGASVGLRF